MVGDGYNDLGLIAASEYGVAYGAIIPRRPACWPSRPTPSTTQSVYAISCPRCRELRRRGRRLGLGSTKALVSVHGEPLIAWHLRMLRHVRDVVVVVGYQAESVIDAVRAIRNDVIFAFNHDYATTGTAASLARGRTAPPAT